MLPSLIFVMNSVMGMRDGDTRMISYIWKRRVGEVMRGFIARCSLVEYLAPLLLICICGYNFCLRFRGCCVGCAEGFGEGEGDGVG